MAAARGLVTLRSRWARGRDTLALSLRDVTACLRSWFSSFTTPGLRFNSSYRCPEEVSKAPLMGCGCHCGSKPQVQLVIYSNN